MLFYGKCAAACLDTRQKLMDGARRFPLKDAVDRCTQKKLMTERE